MDSLLIRQNEPNSTLNDTIDDSTLWRFPTYYRIEVYMTIIFLGIIGFIGLCVYVYVKK